MFDSIFNNGVLSPCATLMVLVALILPGIIIYVSITIMVLTSGQNALKKFFRSVTAKQKTLTNPCVKPFFSVAISDRRLAPNTRLALCDVANICADDDQAHLPIDLTNIVDKADVIDLYLRTLIKLRTQYESKPQDEHHRHALACIYHAIDTLVAEDGNCNYASL